MASLSHFRIVVALAATTFAGSVMPQSPDVLWSKGNMEHVDCVSLSSNGQFAATASSQDGVVHVWSMSPAAHLLRRVENNFNANCVAFTTDSAGFALAGSGSYDSIKFYSVSSGLPTGVTATVAEASDTDAILFRTVGGTQYMYTQHNSSTDFVAQWKKVGNVWTRGITWPLSGLTLRSFDVSNDGSKLAVGAGSTVLLYNTNDAGRTVRGAFSLSSVQEVDISPNGAKVAAVGSNRLLVYTIASTDIATSPSVAGLRTVRFTPNSADIVSGTTTNNFVFRFNGSAQPTATIAQHSSDVTSLDISPQGIIAANGVRNRLVSFYAVANNLKIGGLQGHSRVVNSLSFDPNGQFVVTTGADERAIRFQASSGLEVWESPGPAEPSWGNLLSNSVLGNGTEAVVSSNNNHLRIFQTSNGQDTGKDLTLSVDPEIVVSSPAALGSHGNVIAATQGKNIVLWSPSSLSTLSPLNEATSTVLCMAYNRVGAWFATGSADNFLRIYRTTTGTSWGSPQAINIGADVKGVAFDPGGTRLAVVCNRIPNLVVYKRVGVVWSFEKQLTTVLPQAPSMVRYSADGRILAVAERGSNGAMRLYNAVTGAVLATYQSINYLNAFEFSPDNSKIAYVKGDAVREDFQVVMLRNPYAVTPVASIIVTPQNFIGGSSTSVTGKVTLEGVAPKGGVRVTLTSSNSGVVTVPATVTVPYGLSTVNFAVTHARPPAQTNVTVSARSSSSATKTYVVTVRR